MQKLFVLSILLIIINISSVAHANSTGPLSTHDGYEVGFQAFFYKYEEQVNGAFFMSTQGKKPGLTFAATNAYDNRMYSTVDARIATGNVSYASNNAAGSNFPDTLFETRAIAGIDIPVGTQLLSPYLGLGYRYLYNDLTTLSSGGYRRESEYLYMPLGVIYRFQLGSDARLSSGLEYDYLIQGVQHSYLSDSDSRYNDLTNIQNQGTGARLHVTYEKVKWSVGIFYTQWNIADSDRANIYKSGVYIGYGIEPQNVTREAGLQLKFHL